MAALTADRKSCQYVGSEIALTAAEDIYAGAMVQINSEGKVANATAAGGKVIGVAAHGVKAGEAIRVVRAGVFGFVNDSGDGVIAATEIGETCYAADNQTVTKTAGNAKVGEIFGFDGDVVLVKI
jgi:predicted RecA/RadA family phage recombinase